MKRLEELIEASASAIRKLEEENAALKMQVESLAAERRKSSASPAAARELEEFKSRVKKRLTRVMARIDRAVTLQDTLFPEGEDAV